jgi:tol-pal system protein YbgF
MQQSASLSPLLHILYGPVPDIPPAACMDAAHHGKVTMQKKTLWIGLVAVVLLCSCAIQDDIYTLDHRLSALERRNMELEKQNREMEKINQKRIENDKDIASRVAGLDKTRRDDEMELRSQYAGLAAQLEANQEASRVLSGRLEEMEYLLKQKLKGFEENQLKNRERMDRLATDMAAIQKRLDIVDKYLNLEGAKTKKQAASPQTKTSAPTASDRSIYLEAKKAFDEGHLEDARKRFEKLIASYPKSQHADNAQFWIGETYYMQKWYEKAILEYQKVIENYPSGNKVPAALLKQGISFLKIGETNNARLLLQELVNKYPGTNEAGIAKQKLETF